MSDLNEFQRPERGGSDLKEFERRDEGWSDLNRLKAMPVCGFRQVWLDVDLATSGLAPSLFWGQLSSIISLNFFLTGFLYV